MPSGTITGSSTENFGVTLRWSTTPNPKNNSSTVTVDLYLNYYTLDIGARTATISIDGTDYSLSVSSQHDMSSGWKDKKVATKSVTLFHDSDGTKSAVQIKGVFPYKLTKSDGTYVGNRNAQGNASFATNDRTTPTISFSASSITTSSFKINASSNVACDQWDYSINGETSWRTFSQTSGTSASVTITGLSSSTTYSVRVRARKESNAMFSSSSVTPIQVTTLSATPPTITHSVSNITANGFTISAVSNVNAYNWYYSIDGGSSYSLMTSSLGTTAAKTVTGLSPNTTYSVKVRAVRYSNDVYGYSTASSVKTLGGSLITSAAEKSIDAASPQLTFLLTVYDSSYYHRLKVKNGGTTVFSVDLGQYSAGANIECSYTLTSAQRTAMLNQIPSAKSFSATLEISTFSDSGYTTQIGDSSSANAIMGTSEATSKPVFTAFTYSDTRQKTVNATENNQVLIKGYSILQVVASAGTARNGASIDSYSVEIGDASKSFETTTMNVGVVDSEGSLTLKVSCIDSRGYSTSVSTTVLVLGYEKPNINSCIYRRKNDIGDIIQLSFGGSFCAIKADGETDTNSILWAGYYYRRTDQETWSNWISIKDEVVVSGNNFAFATNQLMVDSETPLSLDPDYTWEMHLCVRDELDELSSCDLYFVIQQGEPLISLRKRDSDFNFSRVGINNTDPTEALDVKGNIKMNGQTVMGYIKSLTTEDLNNVTKFGLYTQYSASNVTDVDAMHYPLAQAGFLEVLGGLDNSGGMDTFILQRYTGYTCDFVYIRYHRNNTWGSWKKIATAAL